IGDKGDEFRDPDHLYADDLDIFGDGGLFQLLCVARTRMGKQQLAHWLLYPSPVLEAQDRHHAVLELKQKIDLREDLAVTGQQENINADPEKLRGWAGRDIDFNAGLWTALGTLLPTLTVAALVYAVLSYLRSGAAIWTPLLFLLLVNGMVMHRLRHGMRQLFADLDQACNNLHALSGIVRRIEAEQFFSPRLQHLQKKLISGPEPASRAIARLGTLCDLENSRSNMVAQLLEFLVLYSVQVAAALQRWRKRYGSSVAQWLDAIGEMEALLSMGAYAYEHPQDPFPEFHAEGDPCFAATALGHPLLAARNCVRNDVSLDPRDQVLLVSGSNMSGKSTLLRATGINAVLAM
ncbi:MAG: MutS-related protein, partial [Candidatus Angelobacter sp.]